jgi:hypothetical protein
VFAGLALPANRYLYSVSAINPFSRTFNREGESFWIPLPHMLTATANMIIDRIGFNITGSDDSVNTFIRLGVFEQNTTTSVMTKILDTGNITTVGTGVKEATVSSTLERGKLYYFLFSRQGFDFVNVAISVQGPVADNVWYSTATPTTILTYGTGPGGITGAFASTYTPEPYFTTDLPLIIFRLQNI